MIFVPIGDPEGSNVAMWISDNTDDLYGNSVQDFYGESTVYFYPVPTLTEWGMIMLGLLIAVTGSYALWRRVTGRHGAGEGTLVLRRESR